MYIRSGVVGHNGRMAQGWMYDELKEAVFGVRLRWIGPEKEVAQVYSLKNFSLQK